MSVKRAFLDATASDLFTVLSFPDPMAGVQGPSGAPALSLRWTDRPLPKVRRDEGAGPSRGMDVIRRAAAPAAVLLIVANFLFYALAGPNGALRWGQYHRLKAERQIELASLQAERTRVAHHVELLNPRKADPDFAEEMIRKDLGLVRPDELILTMPE